jgi:hypothetical protein
MNHPLAPRSARLSERDLDVLDALADYRFLSIPQLAVLFFPSRGSAERRLRELYQAGLAVRVFLPARPYDRVTHTIYAVSGKGAQLLAPRHDGIPPRWLTGREQRSALFLDHTLRRNDVRICLEKIGTDDPRVQLLAWKQKPEQVQATATIRIPGGKRQGGVRLVPDGVATLYVAGQVHAFAIEVDMGTVPVRRMEARYRAYWRWHRDGGARARFGQAAVRVLTLTTTEARLASLRRAATRAPEHGRAGSALFWFARLAVADIDLPETLLSPCWTTAAPDPGQPRPLLD